MKFCYNYQDSYHFYIKGPVWNDSNMEEKYIFKQTIKKST